jgi:hypothetical protein
LVCDKLGVDELVADYVGDEEDGCGGGFVRGVGEVGFNWETVSV